MAAAGVSAGDEALLGRFNLVVAGAVYDVHTGRLAPRDY